MKRRRSISSVRVCVCRHYREHHSLSDVTGARENCTGLHVAIEGDTRNVTKCQCPEFDEQETA